MAGKIENIAISSLTKAGVEVELGKNVPFSEFGQGAKAAPTAIVWHWIKTRSSVCPPTYSPVS